MPIGNPSVSLPTLSRASMTPTYAGLVPASGKGSTIAFTFNPQRITTSVNAKFNELTLFKSKSSPSKWLGNQADKIRLEDVLITKGKLTDIRPLIEALRGAVGGDVQWSYVHGKRVITPVVIVSLQIVESDWVAGIPVSAMATIELAKQYNTPSVITKVTTKLTKAESANAKKAAEKLGLKSISVDAETGIVSSNGKRIGVYKAGKLVRDDSKTQTAVNNSNWRPPTATWKPGDALPKGYPKPPANYGVKKPWTAPKPPTKPVTSSTNFEKATKTNSWQQPDFDEWEDEA